MGQIGKDVDFGLDNFQRPKMHNENHSMAQSLLNLLLMRKGQLPSLPHIGIDINRYLYTFADGIDIDKLLNEIREQCNLLLPFVDSENASASVVKASDGTDVLMIIIPIIGTTVVFNFFERNDVVEFNYAFSDDIIR